MMEASSSTKVVLHACHGGWRRRQHAWLRKKKTHASLLAVADGIVGGCHRLEHQLERPPMSKGAMMAAW